MFFGNGEDDSVKDQRNYRKINLACASLDLSHPTLDVRTFKKLLQCFNSNGALQAYEDLMNRLTDEEIEPIVHTLNKYILNNQRVLYQLDRTYAKLKDRRLLDASLMQLGRLLENEEFVASGIALLRDTYSTGRSNSISATGIRFLAADPSLLKSLERLSGKITPEGVSEGINLGITLSSSRAYQSLQGRFKGRSPGDRQLRDLTDRILNYMRDDRDPQHVQIGRELIKVLINGDLFRAMDEVIGEVESQFRGSVPRLASVFRATMEHDGEVFDGMTSLFHYLHRPIYCLRGTKSVPDADMHVIRELVSQNTSEAAVFIKRHNILTLMAMGPFCDYPEELGVYYPVMYRLADTTAIQPATDLIKAFYRIERASESGHITRPLAELLVKILADTGSGETTDHGEAPRENTAGIKLLIPVMAELTDRNAWEDLLLVSSLPLLADRGKLVDFLEFLVQEAPELGNKSIYDVIIGIIGRTSPTHFYNFTYSLRRFVESSEPLLEPALRILRTAFYVNDVHPLIDLVRGILSEASENERFFSTLFMTSEMPEFQATVRLTSQMAKDGRLKELMGATLTLFHRFALQGSAPIREGTEPPLELRRRHNIRADELDPFPLAEEPALASESCRRLDTRVRMDEYQGPHFETQLSYFLDCVNSDDLHQDVVDSVNFLRDHRTSDGRTFFNLQIDLLKTLNLSPPQLDYIGDRWIDAFDDGRFFHLMDAIPYWVTFRAQTDDRFPAVAGPVLRPLLDVISPIMPGLRSQLHELESFGGRVLRRDDFPRLLKFGETLLDEEWEPQTQPERLPPEFLPRLTRWVENKECQILSPNARIRENQKRIRARDIIDDFARSVSSWDLQNRRGRRYWTRDLFKDQFLGPVLAKARETANNPRGHTLIDAVLNVLNYFTLPEGATRPTRNQHFSRNYLNRFLMDRSKDYRLITYFYPSGRDAEGNLTFEPAPRVRLVNTLDLLELVLINADFTLPVDERLLNIFGMPKNFGLKFLADIAEAWGDEDPSIWPEEIQIKARTGWRPPTLTEAVQTIMETQVLSENMMGFPQLPACNQRPDPRDPPNIREYETREPTTATSGPSSFAFPQLAMVQAHLYNLRQALGNELRSGVLEENRPGSGSPLAGGLKVLRDLFYELYYTTPPAYRNPNAGDLNNLSVVIKIVRLGLTRNLGRYLRNFDENDRSLANVLNSVLDGAQSGEAKDLLRLLLIDDQNQDLVWKIFDQVFSVINAAEDHDLDEAHSRELHGKTEAEIRRIKQEWVRELERLKQMGYYAIAEAGTLNVIEPVLRAIREVLQNHRPYLTAHADRVGDVFRSKRTSYVMRGLYESTDQESKDRFADLLRDALSDSRRASYGVDILKAVDLDPRAHAAWDVFQERRGVISKLPQYQQLHIDEISRQILHFFEEEDLSPSGIQAAEQVRLYLAARMEGGDFDEILLLARENPNEFYRILQTTSHYIENGELKDFFRLVRRSLSE